MSFSKMSEIIEASQTKKLPFWKVIMDDDVEERKVTEKESFSRMEKMLDAMLEADKRYKPDLRSQSGLSGGDGAKLESFRKQENRLIGTFLAMVMEKAVKMASSVRRLVWAGKHQLGNAAWGASFPSERALPAGGFGSVHTPSP